MPRCRTPLPLTVKEVQPLLSADEAMVLFAVVEKESYVVAFTREGVDWKAIPLRRGRADAEGDCLPQGARCRQGA